MEQVLAADSDRPGLASMPCCRTDGCPCEPFRSQPSWWTADGITDLAATSEIALTPPYVGQAESRQTTIGDSDEWLGEEMDLEEILELIADKVRSNWWDS